jgi:opacity protein-like surface antigen
MHLELKKSQLAVLGGLALMAACATTMQADGIAPGFYLSSDTGLNMMTGIRGEGGGGGGTTLRLDPGMRWGLEAGYGIKVADQLTLGLEAESGFVWNGFSSLESGSRETELGGNAWQIPFLANLVLNYHVNKWTPYFGFGGGLDYISANIWSSDGHPTILAASDIGPAMQAEAGVKYQLTDHVEVGLGYKYLTAFSEKVSGDRLSEVNNHTLGLSLTLHF